MLVPVLECVFNVVFLPLFSIVECSIHCQEQPATSQHFSDRCVLGTECTQSRLIYTNFMKFYISRTFAVDLKVCVTI